jgi:replicative DNA helicase
VMPYGSERPDPVLPDPPDDELERLQAAVARDRMANPAAAGGRARAVWNPPEPVDGIDRIPLPDSSEGRYPAHMWAFVDAVAESLQVPRDMALMVVLSILSTASGGRWRARIAADWVEPLALMTVTCMPSGERKSGTVRLAADPLYEAERDLYTWMAPKIIEAQARKDLRQAEVERVKRDAARGKADEQAIVEAMVAAEEATVPPMPRLIADDITPERLGSLMGEQNGRMGVISAEGGLFAILAGRYSSGAPNLDLVLKAHAGDPVRIDRQNRDRPPLIIDEPFLAIGVTVQPDILEGLAETRLFRGAGLLARFLYALPDSLIGRRALETDPVPVDVRREYSERVKRLANHAYGRQEIVELPLTDDAAKLLLEFRRDHEPRLHPLTGDLTEIVDWASKLPGQLVRVAALLALFQDHMARVVDDTAMQAALDLAEYLTGQAQAAFDAISGRHARSAQPLAVLAWIRRKRLTSFTVRQARRDLGGQEWARDVDTVRDVLDELADLHWIRLTPSPDRAGPGRPASERYEVNPATHKADFRQLRQRVPRGAR